MSVRTQLLVALAFANQSGHQAGAQRICISPLTSAEKCSLSAPICIPCMVRPGHSIEDCICTTMPLHPMPCHSFMPLHPMVIPSCHAIASASKIASGLRLFTFMPYLDTADIDQLHAVQAQEQLLSKLLPRLAWQRFATACLARFATACLAS